MGALVTSSKVWAVVHKGKYVGLFETQRDALRFVGKNHLSAWIGQVTVEEFLREHQFSKETREEF